MRPYSISVSCRRTARVVAVRMTSCSQLLDRGCAEHEPLDAVGSEVHGDYGVAALVLGFQDRAETVFVVGDLVADVEIGDVQAVVLAHLRCAGCRALLV